MIQTFTLNQLLEYRRIAAGLKFLRSDCTVERVDGFDLDATDAQALRLRYLQLLDTAPAHLLPTADIADEITLTSDTTMRATATLPERCRRLLNIRLSNWSRPALPMTREAYDALPGCRRELSPYCMPGILEPVAVAETDGTVSLTPATARNTVDKAIAVVDPGDGTYTIDESLLDELCKV